MINKNYGATNFITGMRAWAAFGVFLIHAGGAGLRDLSSLSNSLVDIGKTGVYAFFVISGFTVAESFFQSSSYGQYILKRIFRIAPLYLFAVSLQFLLLNFTSYGVKIPWAETLNVDYGWFNYLLHIGFLSFLDYRYTNSVLGVEWSIPIEVFWYFIIPLFLTNSKWIGKVAFCIFSLALYWGGRRYLQSSLSPSDFKLAFHWSPSSYGFCFFLGVFAHSIRPYFFENKILKELHTPFLLFALMLFLWKPFTSSFQFISFGSFVFIVLGGQNSFHKYLFEDKRILFLGTVSYSFYIWHYLVIISVKRYLPNMNLTCFFLVTLTLGLFLGWLSYRFIEVPSQKYLKTLLSKSF